MTDLVCFANCGPPSSLPSLISWQWYTQFHGLTQAPWAQMCTMVYIAGPPYSPPHQERGRGGVGVRGEGAGQWQLQEDIIITTASCGWHVWYAWDWQQATDHRQSWDTDNTCITSLTGKDETLITCITSLTGKDETLITPTRTTSLKSNTRALQPSLSDMVAIHCQKWGKENVHVTAHTAKEEVMHSTDMAILTSDRLWVDGKDTNFENS